MRPLIDRMCPHYTVAQIDEAADVIRRTTRHRPRVGLVLGSGLGRLAERVEDADVIPYDALPHFPRSTVAGHAGRLVLGCLGGRDVLVMQGRAHYYEGYSLQQVTFPVRVMQRLGIAVMVVTNAAGGLNAVFAPGDIMLISDQLNLVAMAGLNPLRGPNQEELGPRFPMMGDAYDPELRELTRRVAASRRLPLQEGVYCMVAGPNFETEADIRFLRSVGVDAVGMSTVPEVLVARHGNMRVLGLSVITNVAWAEAGPAAGGGGHEEVLTVADRVGGQLCELIQDVLMALDDLE